MGPNERVDTSALDLAQRLLGVATLVERCLVRDDVLMNMGLTGRDVHREATVVELKTIRPRAAGPVAFKHHDGPFVVTVSNHDYVREV